MNREQGLIALAGVPVLALTLSALGAVETGAIIVPAAWTADRLSLAAGCVAVLGGVLTLSIWRIALFRFVSDADRPGAGLAGAPGPALRIHLAVLQNTLEQTLAAALAYLAFAALAPARLLPLLPLYAGLFVLGRIAFALGYRFGAPGRAFGFGLTLVPTVTLYALLALWLLAPPASFA